MSKLELRNWLGEAATLGLREMEAREGTRPALPPQAAASTRAATLETRAALRRELRDDLFGRGFLLPGGETEVLRLARPLHLTHAAHLLVVGTGICGPADTLASQLGLEVGGYDRLPANEEALCPRARLVTWDPARGNLPRNAFHHASALHPLHDGPPEPVLVQIVDALRPGAHLILLEHVATERFDPDDETAQAWLRHEGRIDPPPAAHELERALARLGMHMGANEDLSHLHARLTVYDWRRLVDRTHERPSAERGQVMLEEAGGWSMRGRLLQNGSLRLMRWHAVMFGAGATRTATELAEAPAGAA